MTAEAIKEGARGTYVLLLQVEECSITVGRLGRLSFSSSLYAYVGSALGSGGLAARLARHRRSQKTRHWHIDHLLEHARIVGVHTDATGRRLECVWSRALQHYCGREIGVPHFGASDCRCRTHLFYLGSTSGADLDSIAEVLAYAAGP